MAVQTDRVQWACMTCINPNSARPIGNMDLEGISPVMKASWEDEVVVHSLPSTNGSILLVDAIAKNQIKESFDVPFFRRESLDKHPYVYEDRTFTGCIPFLKDAYVMRTGEDHCETEEEEYLFHLCGKDKKSKDKFETLKRLVPFLDDLYTFKKLDYNRFTYNCPVTQVNGQIIKVYASYHKTGCGMEKQVYEWALWEGEGLPTALEYINNSERERFKQVVIQCLSPWIALIQRTHGRYAKYNPLVMLCNRVVSYAERTLNYGRAAYTISWISTLMKPVRHIPRVLILYLIGLVAYRILLYAFVTYFPPLLVLVHKLISSLPQSFNRLIP